jgi:IS5 family transposase
MVPLLEIFCFIDDFCKYFEEVSGRRALGNPKAQRRRAYTMALSEIMTILTVFHLSHYRTFKDFYLNFVCVYWRSEFPKLVSYNRFVELMKNAIFPLAILLHGLKGQKTGKYYIDSTKLFVCHNLRISRHKVFKEFASRGKTSTGWFFVFKLHLVFNEKGEIMSLTLTSGNCDDRLVVQKLVKGLEGWLFGDRGYISKDLKNNLKKQGLELITNVKKNMKKQPLSSVKRFLLNSRRIVETAIGQLKEICHIQHTRHRSPDNFLANLFSGLLAYILKPAKPSISWGKKLFNLSLISN